MEEVGEAGWESQGWLAGVSSLSRVISCGGSGSESESDGATGPV